LILSAFTKAVAVALLFFHSALVFAASSPTFSDRKLFSRLKLHAPGLNAAVLESALTATRCAVTHGMAPPQRLAVIDFSLPSSEKRLWIFDLKRGSLLLRDLVAHGRNSGELDASAFSNTVGSHQSSLGLFQAAETYHGKHGYSLRLDGLEPGINDRARERAIVIHGADYVAPQWIENHGRIGRSFGCPAVRQQIARQVVDNLKNGQLVFSYYPDPHWLGSSSYLNCDNNRIADTSRRNGHQI
jgi:L,D-transpeptidase catalytic domain